MVDVQLVSQSVSADLMIPVFAPFVLQLGAMIQVITDEKSPFICVCDPFLAKSGTE